MRPLSPCSVRGCPQRAARRGLCEHHAAESDERYRAAHPDTRPAYYQRYNDPEWKQIRAAYIKAHPMCAECGEKGKHVDHIKPRSQGGTNDMGNLQTLCHSCHSRKTGQGDGAWGNPVR
jgi:5-methylcytosine-specific restriction enzyme A